MKALFLALALFAVAYGQSDRCKGMEDILNTASRKIEIGLGEFSQRIAGVCDQTGAMYGNCIDWMQNDLTLMGNAIQYVEEFKETRCKKADFAREELEEAKKTPCSGAAHYLFKEQLCGETLIDFDHAMAKIKEAKDKNGGDAWHVCQSSRLTDACIADLMEGPNWIYDKLKGALVEMATMTCEVEAHTVCKEMSKTGRKLLTLTGY